MKNNFRMFIYLIREELWLVRERERESTVEDLNRFLLSKTVSVRRFFGWKETIVSTDRTEDERQTNLLHQCLSPPITHHVHLLLSRSRSLVKRDFHLSTEDTIHHHHHHSQTPWVFMFVTFRSAEIFGRAEPSSEFSS